MQRSQKLSCLLPAILFTFLPMQRSWAQGYEPPVLSGSAEALPVPPRVELPVPPRVELPVPPRVELPVPLDIAGEALPFANITVGWQSCRVPCRLFVLPGLQPVIASGKASLVTHVEVPRSPARLQVWDRTGGYRVAGAILIPVGIVTASGLWALGIACGRDSACTVANFTVWPLLGIGALFTGIGLLGYAANHDRYGLRIAPSALSASGGLRLTGLAAAPTAEGAAMGASFAF